MVIQGVTYLSDFEAKKAIIEAARRMEAKGFLVAGDGSLSVRVGPSAAWVTIAGADKAALTQDMLVRVDLNGKQMLSARAKPLPEDLPIHLKIYQENESVQCVLHAYPPCAAVMGLQGQSVQPAAFSPAVRALGRVQLLPGQAAEPQAQAVSLLCRTDKGVLLQNDGCMTWGRTHTEACHLVEALDYYAAVTARLGHTPVSAPAVSAAPAVQPAPAPVEAAPASAAALNGVTGLIRPGMGLPPLPKAQPAASAVPVAPVASKAVPAAPAAAAAPAQPAPKAAAREDAMAEVIRRTLQSFQ